MDSRPKEVFQIWGVQGGEGRDQFSEQHSAMQRQCRALEGVQIPVGRDDIQC